ncbi:MULTISPECIES: hypothetical protein [Rhizobium]|uniref:hypothetical protein n=1 Tax=Rhizobium TaxID=379 RepID=UPI001A9251F4|nr:MULTISPECIES: hypothetical protein [Rhizobium]MBX5017531.1 hypothetical protein [Rhizobium lentis]MBX5063472.1 hypothetical protein [Rhizobium lentis]MBX5075578.1 hypothetical protein [Rhizobium lentis]MBX5255988.1 hypothetical protein [Rhizobium sp. NLR16b]MBX5262083.1 hypothetical protein [Rhizobium sp. NLR16a]
MAKLPEGFSVQAIPIRSALAEGRTEDAKTEVVRLLLTGKADKIVQRLAAEMIRPPKRGRGRRSALTRHWHEIGEEYHQLREAGVKYEDALRIASEKFGYSETHVRNAIADYDQGRSV